MLVRSPKEVSVGATHESFWVVTICHRKKICGNTCHIKKICGNTCHINKICGNICHIKKIFGNICHVKKIYSNICHRKEICINISWLQMWCLWQHITFVVKKTIKLSAYTPIERIYVATYVT